MHELEPANRKKVLQGQRLPQQTPLCTVKVPSDDRSPSRGSIQQQLLPAALGDNWCVWEVAKGLWT